MKTRIILLFLLMATMVSFGQKLIDEKKVPQEVIRTFKKKVTGPTETKWFQRNNEYIAKYKLGEYSGETEFTKEGVITLQKTGIDPKDLPSSIQGELAREHKGKRIHEVFLIVKGKKEKYYSIILHQKQGRKEPPLVFEAQYTMQGKLITVYEPTVEEVAPEEGEERPSKFSKDVDKDMDELKTNVKDEKINRKDLPTSAETYLTENFDYEYRAKEILVKSNTKYGQYYQVIMKKQGEKKEHVLLFDFNGELLSRKEVEL